MKIKDILQQKRGQVFLYRDDVVEVKESLGWAKRHPLGPVHFDFVCKCCGEMIASDIADPDLNDNVWGYKLFPHVNLHR